MSYNLQDIFGPTYEERSRTIYARIIPLDFNSETPGEPIEGRVTGGSINIDGSSAVRRSCSLSLVTEPEAEINEIDWALKNKFKVEIGLENDMIPFLSLPGDEPMYDLEQDKCEHINKFIKNTSMH